MIQRTAPALLTIWLAARSPEQSIGDDGPHDAGAPDAASPDTGAPDAGEPDADVSGTYTVTLTNGENGCAFSSWQPGATATISLVITQTGNALAVTVSDLGGVSLSLLTGSGAYAGIVHGNDFSLEVYGTVVGTQMGCPFTWDGCESFPAAENRPIPHS